LIFGRGFLCKSDQSCFSAAHLFRSTFFPRILGLLLAIGGLGYWSIILANVITPAIRTHLFPYMMLPAGIAETSLTLWLIIVGVNVQRWKERASAAGE
jgi:hypothetical protein